MVVFRNKQFVKCEEFPDTDFTDNADWVLDDNDNNDAELEAKIIELYPNFELIISDDGSKIVDVVEIEPPPEPEKPPEPPTNAELAAAIAELAEVICGG